MKSSITSHVLDTSLGRPAKNLTIRLFYRGSENTWQLLAEKATNDDGRVTDFVPGPVASGTYRLSFDTGPYLEATTAKKAFYPSVDVVFELDAAAGHHHVPLLLNPYGYSTYRGS